MVLIPITSKLLGTAVVVRLLATMGDQLIAVVEFSRDVAPTEAALVSVTIMVTTAPLIVVEVIYFLEHPIRIF
jgi:hypothetical protein